MTDLRAGPGRRAWLLMFVGVLWAIGASPAGARTPGASGGAVHAVDAHVRPAVRSQRELDVTVRIENRGPAVDQLLGANSPLARSVSLIPAQTPRRGSRLPGDGLVLAPGQILLLGPGGGAAARLVMRDLQRALRAGEVFPLELSFQRAGRVMVSVQVSEGPSQRGAAVPAGVKDCQMPDPGAARRAGLC